MNNRKGYDIFPPLSLPSVVFTTLVIAGLAVLLRLSYFTDSPLPINDGGLFYAYASTILDNNLSFPPTVDFNGLSLPFAYPPLSFWLAALISSLFELDLLTVVRYFPFVVHLVFLTLYIPFLRSLHLPWSAVILASTILFLSHRSYEFLIMGGGMSRATGAAFALAAFIEATKIVSRSTFYGLIATSAFSALSILSHPEWGIVSALGVTLIVLLNGKQLDRNIKHLFLIGAMTALLVAPWIIWVFYHHGPAPFLNASETSGWGVLQTLHAILSMNIFLWYLGFFCVIGLWESLKKREYLWVTFTLLLALVTPRHFSTAAVISNSVLAAVGIAHIWQLCNKNEAEGMRRFGSRIRLFSVVREINFLWLVTLVAGYTLTASYLTHTLLSNYTHTLSSNYTHTLSSNATMETLSHEAYDAMTWIRDNVGAEERFVVVSPDPWFIDEVNEWFPVLAGAISLTTVQGTEWISNGEFQKREEQVGRLKENPGCPYVAGHILKEFPEADYIMAVLHRDCFDNKDSFAPLYANSGAGVYFIKKSEPH